MAVKRGGLGRNLDSLIPTPIRAPGVETPVAGRLEVDIESIKPNRKQPRSIFNDEELSELAASIKEIGILQPPVVRKVGENQYELIMGERRLRASKLAGSKVIPVIIRETSDNELLREGHARALLGLTDFQEIERIANKIVAEGLSVRATEELISVGDSKKSSSKKNLSSLGKYQELEEKIGDALDTRVKIKGGANGGKIQIEFADSEDLLRIAKKLS